MDSASNFDAGTLHLHRTLWGCTIEEQSIYHFQRLRLCSEMICLIFQLSGDPTILLGRLNYCIRSMPPRNGHVPLLTKKRAVRATSG
jgi:hypothetical protein